MLNNTNYYEKLLFKVAPFTKEVMQVVKSLNNNHFMRGRTGWVRRGIENPEPIYIHDCKVGIAAWYLFKTEDAVAQAVAHEFPEIIRPDYVPGEVDSDYKKETEFAAMRKLKNKLPNGDYWFNMWMNFENKIGIGEQITELDKMCPVIQAIDYSKTYKNHNLEEFYPYARKKIITNSLVELLDGIYKSNIPENESAYHSYFRGLEEIQVRKEL